jgi:hypothetical protein
MSKDFSLEIFNEQMKAWVSLNLAQFYHLFKNLEFSCTESELYLNQIFKTGLEFRLNLRENEFKFESLNENPFKIGEFVEVKKQIYSSFHMDYENGKLVLKLASDDKVNPYTIWAREKIISQADDYLTLSCVDDSVQNTQTKNIRRLSGKVNNDCKDFDYVFKRVVLSNDYNDKDAIEQILDEITREYKFDNLFFNTEEDDNKSISINICSEEMNIMFFYNLLLIKLESEKEMRKLEEEIKGKERNLNKLSKILTDDKTQIFDFSKEFEEIIEKKILIPFKNSNGLNYIKIDGDSQDQIKILIIRQDKEEIFTPLSRLKECYIELEPKIANWLMTDRMNNFNKIVENSKIVSNNFKIDWIQF